MEVLLVYEDLSTGLRAREAFEHVVGQLEMEADFDLKLWRFELLREPALLERAVSDGAEADIVFLAAHDGELPPVVKLWFNRWLERKDGERWALAVSLDPDADDTLAAGRMLGPLGAALSLASVDVFLHRGHAPPMGSDTGTDGTPQQTRTGTAAQAESLHDSEDYPSRDWGINE